MLTVVVDAGVLLLLDLKHRLVAECPLDDVRLLAGTLHILALADGRPELAEVLLGSQYSHIRRGECGRVPGA